MCYDRSVRLWLVDCDSWVLLYQYVTFVLNDMSWKGNGWISVWSCHTWLDVHAYPFSTFVGWLVNSSPLDFGNSSLGLAWIKCTKFIYIKQPTKANNECDCVLSASLVALRETVDSSCHLVISMHSSWHFVSGCISHDTSLPRWIPRATSCE